jgi:hypothetical protein
VRTYRGPNSPNIAARASGHSGPESGSGARSTALVADPEVGLIHRLNYLLQLRNRTILAIRHPDVGPVKGHGPGGVSCGKSFGADADALFCRLQPNHGIAGQNCWTTRPYRNAATALPLELTELLPALQLALFVLASCPILFRFPPSLQFNSDSLRRDENAHKPVAEKNFSEGLIPISRLRTVVRKHQLRFARSSQARESPTINYAKGESLLAFTTSRYVRNNEELG